MVTHKSILIKENTAISENDEEEVGRKILSDTEKVSGVTFLSKTKDIFGDVMDKMQLVVYILIIAAGLLAFAVLYNLSNVNKNNNTIILNNAWTYGTIKKGTKLSQSSDNGGTYKYPLVFGQSLSNTSKKYSSIISNIGSNENNFRYATKYVRVVLLLNYSSTFSSIDTQYTYVKNIIFE